MTTSSPLQDRAFLIGALLGAAIGAFAAAILAPQTKTDVSVGPQVHGLQLHADDATVQRAQQIAENTFIAIKAKQAVALAASPQPPAR